MTRIVKSPKAKSAKSYHRPRAARRTNAHERDEVGVISVDKVRRRKNNPTGKALIAAMQASPNRGLDIAPERTAMRVRKGNL
jgi:hypothetical protein